MREVEAALGNGRLEGPSEAEAKEMYSLARRSIVAARDIPEGTEITREMLTTKRPGYGISAEAPGAHGRKDRPRGHRGRRRAHLGDGLTPSSTRRPLAAESFSASASSAAAAPSEAVVRGALPSWAAAMKSASSSR